MRTITFFSYKGGTGRSLAVANAAYYLTQLDFKVAVLDFDLEAPGLAYKFSQAEDGTPISVKRGLVDYLFSLVVEGRRPSSLSDYSSTIHLPGDKGKIVLIPAGEAPSTQYWAKLSRFNWHELFYAPDAKGVKLFLDLKIRIQEEFKPDFLLIDSRTGVTEMGGVATTILADVVLCILLNNRENMEGARAVLRSLRRSQRKNRDGGVTILTALSQVPELKDIDKEQSIVKKMLGFLCEEAENLEDTLSLEEVFVLHSEPALQLRESLRVGKGMSFDESILLRDYLRLFSQIVPAQMIEPRIENLFESAKSKLWDDPDGTTKEMEQLAEFYGRPEGFREVLKLYILRNVEDTKAMRMAQRYWELTHDAEDATVGRTVLGSFKEFHSWSDQWKPRLDFVENVWRGAAKQDVELGYKLAESYDNFDKPVEAAEIYLRLIYKSEQGQKYVGRCLELLLKTKKKVKARQVIEDFKETGLTDPKFLVAWAKLALSENNVKELGFLSEEPMFSKILEKNSSTALSIYEMTGRKQDIENLLERIFADAIQKGPSDALYQAGRIYAQQGRLSEYEMKVRQTLSSRDADHFLRDILRELR